VRAAAACPSARERRDELQPAAVLVVGRRAQLAREDRRPVVDLDDRVARREPQAQLDRRRAVQDAFVTSSLVSSTRRCTRLVASARAQRAATKPRACTDRGSAAIASVADGTPPARRRTRATSTATSSSGPSGSSASTSAPGSDSIGRRARSAAASASMPASTAPARRSTSPSV
jgi:hypothetical protein